LSIEVEEVKLRKARTTMFRPVCRVSVTVALCTMLLVSAGFSQSGKLEFADRPRLVSCDPSTSKPCFRLKFNVVDSQGAPLSLNLPPNQDLRGQMKTTLDNQEIAPFYAVAQSGGGQIVRGRVALILVDISGSMNIRLASGKTRFQTAQEALQQFVEGFDESVDRVAIVPFESHNVAEPINNAVFARKKADALAQIESLPVPGPKNNTALYSAVVLGLQVLTKQVAATPGSVEAMMILMTDGKNEVFKGDDAGLLDGPSGLEAAANAVRTSGAQAICIGFGDPGSIDENALRTISRKFYMAQDSEKLKQIFTFARTLLANRIVATVPSPWPDRSSLEGRSVPIKADLTLPDGRHFESDSQTWQAPQMGAPTFDGKCDVEELKAALQLAPTEGSWLTTLRPVLVFFGLGTLLLVLWFWVPRLVWADQYIGTFQTQGGGGMRWASKSQVVEKDQPMRPSRPAPPGFETQRGGAQPPRAPGERTVVQPDFSKSRLQKRPPQS
jgi:Ca-activated chloride channel family protein